MKSAFRIVALSMLIVVGLSASAQRHAKRAEKMAKNQVEKLTQKLTLNEEQAKKVEAVFVEFNKKYLEAYQADTTKKTPSPELVEKRNADLKVILTPEQYKTFNKMPMSKGNVGPMHKKGNRQGKKEEQNSEE